MLLLYISSSYAKILGETNFRTQEIPRSGSKGEDGEKERRRRANYGDNNGQAMHGARKPPGPKMKERLNYGNNNGQLRIANATLGGARMAAWAN